MCLICDRIQMIKEGNNPYFVKELETGYVVLGDNQHFKGYTIFLYKQHATELHELDADFKLKFLEEMSLVGEAVSRAFPCEKMNYELLGNGDSHLHSLGFRVTWVNMATTVKVPSGGTPWKRCMTALLVLLQKN